MTDESPAPLDGADPSVDHVELLVRDRDRAAEWYRRVLGLSPVEEFADWATLAGPLMLSGDGGETKLALFETGDGGGVSGGGGAGAGDGADGGGTAPGPGFRRVAFGVGADAFLAFVERAPELDLSDVDGEPLDGVDVVDHDRSFSVYFSDPYGNRFELTTYEYDAVAERLD